MFVQSGALVTLQCPNRQQSQIVGELFVRAHTSKALRNASSPAARVYLQTLAIQIAGMKAARLRTVEGPEPVPAWISLALGSAYFRSDAGADAEREYRAALAVDPNLGEAHNNLAVVLLLTGRATDADVEIAAAEKSGFKVNPQLKEDVKKALPKR